MNIKCNFNLDKLPHDSKHAVKLLVMAFYMDALCLVNLFINTSIFRRYELGDVLAIVYLICFILAKSCLVTRLINPKLIQKEWPSVVALILTVIFHQELNMQYLLLTSDMHFKFMSVYYFTTLYLALPIVYLSINHRLHPKSKHVLDFFVVLYFSFRRTYQQDSVADHLVSGGMNAAFLLLYKVVIDHHKHTERIILTSASQTRTEDIHDVSINNMHEISAHPQAEDKVDERNASYHKESDTTADTHIYDYEYYFTYSVDKRQVVGESRRTNDKKLLSAFSYIKQRLNNNERIRTGTQSLPLTGDLKDDDSMQDIESEYCNEQGLPIKRDKFVFDKFDGANSRVTIKSTHRYLNDAIEDLVKEYCKEKPDLLGQHRFPFSSIIDKTKLSFTKSKTFNGKDVGSLSKTKTTNTKGFDPVKHDQELESNKFIKKASSFLPEKTQVEIVANIMVTPPQSEIDQETKVVKTVYTPVYFEVTIVPILHSREASAISISSTVKEVELRIYLKKPEQKNNKTTMLLNLISHEMRSPLVAILGLIRLFISKTTKLHHYTADRELMQLTDSYLLNACATINNLLEACQCILDLTKKGKEGEFKPMEFNLHKLITETTKLFHEMNASASSQSKKDLELLVDYERKCPETIKSDPIRIRQILINLISNAWKYTEKGSVTVKVDMLDFNNIRISVIDTGIGIKRENLNKLFKEFGRIKSKQDEILNEKGVGLGLNLSNQLAYSLSPADKKSSITVTSSYGKGSCFSFIVYNFFLNQMELEAFQTRFIGSKIQDEIMEKVDRLDGQSHMQIKSKVVKKALTVLKAENTRVLIIDDSEHNLEFTEEIFSNLNIYSESSSNPEQALELVKKRLTNRCPGCRVFDLILVDYEMPIMNGSEFAIAVRKIPEYTKVPIICATAQELDLDDLTNKCFSGTMLKPISNEDVQNLIDTYIQQKSPHQCYNTKGGTEKESAFSKSRHKDVEYFTLNEEDQMEDCYSDNLNDPSNLGERLTDQLGDDTRVVNPENYASVYFKGKPKNQAAGRLTSPVLPERSHFLNLNPLACMDTPPQAGSPPLQQIGRAHV